MEDLEALEPIKFKSNKELFRDWIYEKAEKYIKNTYPDAKLKYDQLKSFHNFTEGAFVVWELFINDEL